MDKLTLQSIVLTRDIQSFRDEFADFSRDCAFLTDAFTELVEAESNQSDSTTMGLSIYSQWVKSRTAELNKNIREISRKSNKVLRQSTSKT
ncbi:MAG: hypothetical protein ACPH4D_00860 [Porticoccaceae bacterium]|jgi:hypothetical protein